VRIVAWPAPGGDELAMTAGPDEAARRILIVPALFEEANRTRRMWAEAIRAMAAAGVFAALGDLPGCNESLAPLERQTLASWRAAMAAAAQHFSATHVLSLRGGALVAPEALPGWRVEPIAGVQVLRPLLRARTIAAREERHTETIDGLLEMGRREGLELAGYRLGAALVAELAEAEPEPSEQASVALTELGGAALWLRSEPGEDPALSAALARLVA
jgi:hypothetical protein